MNRFHELLLKFARKQPGSEAFQKLVALWGLVILCFLQAPHLTPVQFVLEYNRWVQFYKADKNGWVNHFTASPLFDDPPAQFWVTLLELVACRHIEQACLLLRKLLLDANSFVGKNPGVIELLLERFLVAPSPAILTENPGLMGIWLKGNSQLFSTSPPGIPRHLEYVFDLVCGRRIPLLIEGIESFEALSAVFNYDPSGFPMTYTTIISTIESVSVEVLSALDRLAFYCLRFSVDDFLEGLLQVAEAILPPWFTAHLLICLSRGGLIDVNYESIAVDRYIHFINEKHSSLRFLVLNYVMMSTQFTRLEISKAVIEQMDEDQVTRSLQEIPSIEIKVLLKKRLLQLCATKFSFMDASRIYKYACLLELDYLKEAALRRYIAEQIDSLRNQCNHAHMLDSKIITEIGAFYSQELSLSQKADLLFHLLKNRKILPEELLKDIIETLLKFPSLLTREIIHVALEAFQFGSLKEPQLELELRIQAIKLGSF